MKCFLGLCLLLAVISTVQPIEAAELQVMTQNQYLGADLTPLLTAPPETFNAAAVAVLQQIAASQPAARLQALAAEIAKGMPSVVGLQEVFLISCTEGSPQAGKGCDEPSIRGAFVDHLQSTLTALQGTYGAAAFVMNINLTAPGIPVTIGDVQVFIQVVDRDVLLVRSDVTEVTPVDYPSVCARPAPFSQGCNYSTVLQVPTPLPPPFPPVLNIERGFVGVDVTVSGEKYRVVTTHLEETDPANPALMFYQSVQATELLGLLQATTPADRSLLVVGDFNSSPEDVSLSPSLLTPYLQFVMAGYNDAWALGPGKLPGYTCCQAPDLLNRQSVLSQRIDLLFSFAYPTKIREARVEGATVSDKTPPPGLGLWPSDHGAVSAELQF